MTEPKSMVVFRDKDNIIIEVLERKIYTVGRFSSNDVFLTSKGVSRCHASIYFMDDGFWIIDGSFQGLASTNGLFVNGHKISTHKLKPYDVIAFCKNVYAIFLEHTGHSEFDSCFENTVKNVALFFAGKKSDNEPFTHEDIDLKTLTARPKQLQLDDLTKLPNRNAFLARVSKSLDFKHKISSKHQFSVLFIDVDRFKTINDSLGHLIGDKFLIELSKRLKTCLRPNDMVARLGGDEFAILIDDISDFEEVITVAKRLQVETAKPLRLNEQAIYPSISVGIASSHLSYQTVEEILRDADIAMYDAKRSGRSRFVVFDESMHQKARELLQLEGELRQAITNQQLLLYYQPIVSLQAKRLVGFEALIRWAHPERGIISPTVFIPLAEETNLIYQIGMWTIEEACRQLADWKNNPSMTRPLAINVNLSAKQLADTRLVKNIQDVLQSYAIVPGEIKLELTESIAMEDSQQTIKVADQLKAIGVPLVVDDFGTGYSSLSYLNRFPIDTLKIDRSFVSNLNVKDENTSLSITHSIIGLAHSLGVKVVAEGIENAYQLVYLKQVKCDYGQGYLFARPMDAAAATSFGEAGLDWHWKI